MSEKLFDFGEEPTETIAVKIDMTARQGWTSFFYKTCRIGCASQALICSEIIRQTQGDYRIALILNQLVGEDLHPVYYEKLFGKMQSLIDLTARKIIKKHNVWQLTYLLAKAPKWYMDNVVVRGLKDEDIWSGSELENLRQIVNVNMKLNEPTDCKKYAEEYDFPDWVWDRHTSLGWKTKNPNLVLDGKWDNRFNIKAIWDRIYEKNPNKSYNELLKIYHAEFKRTK